MINYQLINDSINFYERKFFRRIEVPWMVPSYVDKITKPSDVNQLNISNSDYNLIASGEQSFLYLYMKNNLLPGRYQTVTPCFRDEKETFLNKKYFIKNELIDTLNVNLNNLFKIIDECKEFFQQFLDNVQVVKIDDFSYDLCSKNIELGSYGIRHCDFLSWIYATGCAEPRLSSVINLKQVDLKET